jgi:hypothetical protein
MGASARARWIAHAADEQEIHHQLADDPWAPTEQIVTVSIEPWQLSSTQSDFRLHQQPESQRTSRALEASVKPPVLRTVSSSRIVIASLGLVKNHPLAAAPGSVML